MRLYEGFVNQPNRVQASRSKKDRSRGEREKTQKVKKDRVDYSYACDSKTRGQRKNGLQGILPSGSAKRPIKK